MSDNKQKPQDDHEEEIPFDMYGFFSRKDVIALIIMILLLLAYVLYQAFLTPSVA